MLISILGILVVIGAAYCLLGMAAHLYGARAALFSPAVVGTIYFLLIVFPGMIIGAAQNETSLPFWAVVSGLSGLGCALAICSVLLPGFQVSSGVTVPPRQIVVLFIALGVIALVITYSLFGRIPLLYGIKGMAGGVELSMHEARRLNTLGHRGGDTFYFGEGYLRVFYFQIAPVFVATGLYARRLRDGVWGRGIWWVAFFFVGAALGGRVWMSMQLAVFFTMVFFAFDVLYRDSSKGSVVLETLRKGVWAVLGLFVVVFVMRYFQHLSGRESDGFFASVLSRIYYSTDIMRLFVIFPESEPYRLGSTWVSDMLGFLPGAVQSFSYEVHYLVHGGLWGFTAAPGLFASGYVNFGLYGPFIILVFAGTIYGYAYMRLMHKRCVGGRMVGLFLSMSFALAWGGDVTTLVLPLILAPVMLLAIRVGNGFWPQRTPTL